MKIYRSFHLAAVASLCMVLMSACGGGGSNNGLPPSNPPPSNPPPSNPPPTHGPALSLVAGAISTDINPTGVPSGAGTVDGVGIAARFNTPNGVVMDGTGNLFVADTRNNTIRKITSDGTVSLFAGTPGEWGHDDGAGADARFSEPQGVAVDTSGNIYVADTFNNLIRKITPAGNVTTVAGMDMTSGTPDFHYPVGLTVDASGNIYVADQANYAIRKITPEGVVSTFAGKIGEQGTTDGTTEARFFFPFAVALDASGNLYVADWNTLRKITPDGVVSTFAGNSAECNHVDAIGKDARFFLVHGVTVVQSGPESGFIYVTDTGNGSNGCIRKISPTGEVSTLAGTYEAMGSQDGTGPDARFCYPNGITVDEAGNLYVADQENHTIRKITPEGVVTTLAGMASTGYSGFVDGASGDARFYDPSSVAVDGSGNIYVADLYNDAIRKITAAGVVSTLAGGLMTTNGLGGDGRPQGVAADSTGNIFAADTLNGTICKITHDGVVSIFAGTLDQLGFVNGTGAEAAFDYPMDMAVDGSGNIYVADSSNFAIRKITPEAVVTTLTEFSFGDFPRGVAVDNAGNVYASVGHGIQKITPEGVTSTFAGDKLQFGAANGTGTEARFHHPWGMTADSAGNLYVADCDNHTIRKVTPEGLVSTVVGVAGQGVNALGPLSSATIAFPQDVAVDQTGALYISLPDAILKATF